MRCHACSLPCSSVWGRATDTASVQEAGPWSRIRQPFVPPLLNSESLRSPWLPQATSGWHRGSPLESIQESTGACLTSFHLSLWEEFLLARHTRLPRSPKRPDSICDSLRGGAWFWARFTTNLRRRSYAVLIFWDSRSTAGTVM